MKNLRRIATTAAIFRRTPEWRYASPMEWALITVLVGLAAGVGWLFNRLVGLRNRAVNAWADIDVQLKQRHVLVGSLVEVVRGYARHERQTLESVVEARARAEGARGTGAPDAAGRAEGELGGSIRGLFALVEAYPELKASEQFLTLHRSLVDVEDKIQNARRYYNAVVRDLNTRIQSFPDLLVSRLFRFAERKYFELDSADERAAPRVDLEPR